MIAKRVMQGLALVLSACLVAACGGVGVDHQGDDVLKLLDLSPRSGETGVATDPDVVAVFSDAMSLGAGEGRINDETFFVEDDQGTTISSDAALSDLDQQSATAVIHLSELAAGQTYTIVVKGTLQGAESDPMGVDVRASFTVAD